MYQQARRRIRSWFPRRRIAALREIASHYDRGPYRPLLPRIRLIAKGNHLTARFEEQALALELLAKMGDREDVEYLGSFFTEKATPRSQEVSHDLTDFTITEAEWTEHSYPSATGPVGSRLPYCDGRAAVVDKNYFIHMEERPKDIGAHNVRERVLAMLRK